MKKCSKCNDRKSTSEFRKNRSKSDGLSSWCKDCCKEHHAAYYADNKNIWRRNQAAARDRARAVIIEYLSTHPCIQCGEDDPLVLEFDHHRDKEINVSETVSKGWPKDRILREARKCTVKCANCHRRKTAIENGWYKV